jgi:hypothetical protein
MRQVLLRAAWNDIAETQGVAADPQQRHQTDEMERLLDKLQDDVSHWQVACVGAGCGVFLNPSPPRPQPLNKPVAPTP